MFTGSLTSLSDLSQAKPDHLPWGSRFGRASLFLRKNRYIFLAVQGSTSTLTQVPRDFDGDTQDVADFQVDLVGLGTPSGLTIGEDGDLYGVDDPIAGEYAQRCIIARRLVERGVRFVQQYDTNWDHHGGPTENLEEHFPAK